MLSREKVDAFFANRYGGNIWFMIEPDEKQRLLTTAEEDVRNELDGAELDYSMPAAVGAVCEQAIHLFTDPDAMRDTSKLTAESVEGIGSRSYRSDRSTLLSPRAERYVNQLRSVGGTVRIARG